MRNRKIAYINLALAEHNDTQSIDEDASELWIVEAFDTTYGVWRTCDVYTGFFFAMIKKNDLETERPGQPIRVVNFSVKYL